MIKTKSVKQKTERTDGLRLLVARFRGRGLPKSRYDVWMPNLGPSETLLRDFQNDQLSWREFSRRYRLELWECGFVDSQNHTIRNHGQKFTLRLLQHLGTTGNVTLLCHCSENEQHCHRHLLKAILEGSL